MSTRHQNVKTKITIHENEYECFFDFEIDSSFENQIAITSAIIEPRKNLYVELLNARYSWLINKDDLEFLREEAKEYLKELEHDEILSACDKAW